MHSSAALLPRWRRTGGKLAGDAQWRLDIDRELTGGWSSHDRHDSRSQVVRCLHAADLQLGRRLHGASPLGDQIYLLGQFIDLARSGRIDAIVIASVPTAVRCRPPMS